MPIPTKLALTDQDQAVMTLPVFGPAIVVPVPSVIEASGGGGKKKAQGKPVCVEGDEKSVEMKGCTYISGPYSIPGTGTAKIMMLGTDQKAKATKVNGKPVLMKGTLFTMKFHVESPAQMPPPVSTPDATPLYVGGKGMFIPAQSKFYAK